MKRSRLLFAIAGIVALAGTAALAGAGVLGADGVAPNVVEGTVHTTDGRPVAGATIRISGATGAGRGTTKNATTDEEGRYRLAVPLGHYDVDGFADLEFEDQTYRELWLDRTNPDCGRVMSDRGIERHFVLRVSGPKRCTTNDGNAWHGGDITLAPREIPDDAVVTFTFAPVGPLADGTPGEVQTHTRTGAALHRGRAATAEEMAYIPDVPLGRWRVSAAVQLGDGTTLAGALTTPDGDAGEEVEIVFRANRMYPYGVGSLLLGVGLSETVVAGADGAETADEADTSDTSDTSDASDAEVVSELAPMPEQSPAAGGLPTGRYACSYRSQYAGDIPTSKGVTILAGGRYQGYGGSGTYEIDAGTQEVRWLSGPFAEPDVRATFGEVHGRPAITVVGGGAAEDPDGTNYCTL